MKDAKPHSDDVKREGVKHQMQADHAEPHENTDRNAYWRANLRLIAALLTVWALVSFVFGILLIEQLNAFKIGRLPLGFWFAQQGSIYVFVILVFFYAWRMDRLDRKYGVDE